MSDTHTHHATYTEAAVSAPGAHFADPAPLGLAAFALTTSVLSTVNAGWLPATVEPVVFGLALAYGGIGQFAAGIWEFAKGNTFGATAFSSYGAFWVSFWWLTGHTGFGHASPNDVDKGLGIYLLVWGIFTPYMAVAASRVSFGVLAVFVLLTVTFLVLAWGEFAASDAIHKLGRIPWTAHGIAGVVRLVRRRHGVHPEAAVAPVGPRADPPSRSRAPPSHPTDVDATIRS